MKKKLLTLILFSVFLHPIFLHPAFSQDEVDTVVTKKRVVYWTKGGFLQLNFNQVSLSNWVGGGENAISGSSLLNYYLNYRNADSSARWENTIDIGYGLTRLAESGVRKNEDRIDIGTKYSKRAAKNFNYTIISNFRTQFAPGYKYPNDSTIISKFMAPGFLILSFGIDYKPNQYFSVFLSPATGKGTFVYDTALADSGAFGVEPAIFDEFGNKIQSGKNFRPEYGAYLDARFRKEIVKNIRLQSRLNLFNNYTDENISNRKNIDVTFESTINMKVNEYIAASLFLHLIYDDDIAIPNFEIIEGQKVKTGESPKLQFKQSLGIGFSYRLGKN